ncbi:sensor histidine kinase [Streptomyces sp. NPDC050504]|uniref:sensor histidine kinase n=1 Tax=Streptomyces sp. NPDC050504 TaxID=3365618 RepID=UPI0037AA9ADB
MKRTEYPWLLPSAMSEPDLPGDRDRPRRTVRDWLVDVLFFLVAVFVCLLATEASENAGNSETAVFIDFVVGMAACCTLWLRRRRPVGLPVALTAVSVLVPTASGALLIALFGLGVHRSFRPVALGGGFALAAFLAQPAIRPEPGSSYLSQAVVGVMIMAMAIGGGMLVRARRQLVVALRERAERAETEAELRAQRAQQLAREAIAREMHDVLAHRLTLLSVHAGALEFRPEAPPAEVARAAGVIRDSAHEALQDLRVIIGVLRAPGDADGAEGERPQPTLVTLDALVAESREAGMRVVLDNRVDDPAAVPVATGRNAYRIAQESLTNARKHAPGAQVTVTVTGGPGTGLTVDVRNPAPTGDFEKVPGSGQGLIGLAERAALLGGSLDHQALPGGGFRVTAWLPWAP